jgi:uncharacterized protein YcbX
MKVDSIWQYPVKSFIGNTVHTAECDQLGIINDRVWAIRDLEKGGIRGAKKIGELMKFAARYIDEQRHVVEITLPNGLTVHTDDPNVNDVLSNALGRRVRLDALRPASDAEHFKRGAPDSDDIEVEVRAVFGREPHEPLPNFAVFPPEVIEYESPPGTYYDCYPLMVMTTSALASLRQAVPASHPDVRRFRPSFVVDSGELSGHPEFSWKGKKAKIGTAEIEFRDPCPRCVMTTREITSDIPEDRDILRYIVRELDQNLGVYATVTQPGRISVGDSVQFLD